MVLQQRDVFSMVEVQAAFRLEGYFSISLSFSLHIHIHTHILYLYVHTHIHIKYYMEGLSTTPPCMDTYLFLSNLAVDSAWINSPVCSRMRPQLVQGRTVSWASQRCPSKAMVPHHFGITDLFEILMILLRKGMFPWVHPYTVHTQTNGFQGTRSLWSPSLTSPGQG